MEEVIIWFGLLFALTCVYLFASIAIISDAIDEWRLLNNKERFVFLLSTIFLILVGTVLLNSYIVTVVKFYR